MPACRVDRLHEHGAQLGRARPGDVALAVRFARLVGLRDQPHVAGRVLGALKACGVREDRDRRQRHDLSDPRHGLEPLEVFAEVGLLFFEALLARGLLLHRALPGPVVKLDEAPYLRMAVQGLKQALPGTTGPQVLTAQLGEPRAPEHLLGRVDLAPSRAARSGGDATGYF